MRKKKRLKTQMELQRHLLSISFKVSDFQSRATRMEPFSEEELAEFLSEFNTLLITANDEIAALNKG